MNTKNLLISITLLTLIILIWKLKTVLVFIFGSIVLSVVFDEFIVKLQSVIRISRNLGLIILAILLLIISYLISSLLIPELIVQIKTLNELIPVLLEKLNLILSSNYIPIDLEETLSKVISLEKIQSYGSQLLGYAGEAANLIILLTFILILSILFTVDPQSHKRIIILATPRIYREKVNILVNECRKALGGWLSGMSISAITVFIFTWISLALLKVPLALLSSIVCGLLTFVPTIGPSMATILPASLALTISPTLMVEVIIIRIWLQSLEAFLLTPILLSKTVNLLPTFALIAQFSLGVLLGLPGILLALPLAVVFQVVMNKILVKEIMDKWI
tara:strand:+ start:3323 stop:4324 length:1002 start_codon:yes stop_codon:yes gene_type:complete